MAATITATVGDASSNAYLTLAAAELYMETRAPSTAWDGASDDEKNRALIMATRRVDMLRFEGDKVTSAQALKWPRLSAFDDNLDEYASDAIPQIVQDATCELAYRILADSDTDTLADSGLEGFKRAKVGPLDVEVDKSRRASALPDAVARMLRPVLRSAGLMARLERS